MSSNLVVVALPADDDRVWQISSEKKPHLTLLFLGDESQVSNLEQIVQFVEHAANTTMRRFYLPVDRRGELGADQADVLFFRTRGYDFKAIRDFRATLLKDPNIKTAYDSATQFEGPWQPHLTLGYPATPANKFPDDQVASFYDVNFDRIAVWTGDFEGPEFRLKDYWDDFDLEELPVDVAMSTISTNDARVAAGLAALEHVGVKGMKWGVRKTENGGHIRINQKTNRAALSTEATTAILVPAILMPPLTPIAFLSPRVRSEVKAARAHNKNVKADAKWKKQVERSARGVEVHNKAADEINAKVAGFNSDKRWKHSDGRDIDLTSNPTKQKEYDDAVAKELVNPAYAKAAVQVYGSKSPGDRYTFEVQDHTTGTLKLTDTLRMEHAASDEDPSEMEVRFSIARDPSGHILGFAPEEEDATLAQSAIGIGEAFVDELMHYGIKGMRWGFRKGPPTAVAPTATSRVPHGDKRKTKIETEGGQNHPAHDDAIKVARARVKLKKSGTAALSNQELREVADRLRLEEQVKLLMSSKGKKFVQKELESEGKNVAKKAAKSGAKKVGKVAVSALVV